MANPVLDDNSDALDAVRPEGECLNLDSYNYGVENPECTEIWEDWDKACSLDWTEECSQVMLDMI